MTLETGDTSLAAPVRMGQPGSTLLGHNRFGLTGRSKSFDTRVAAIRPDLADIAVAGEHFAPHYAAPMMCSAIAPVAAMRDAASLAAPQVSELLYGEAFAMLDVTGGWAWGYSYTDHRVGFIAVDALGPTIAPTHRVIATDAALHSSADANSGGSAILPHGALVTGDVQGEWLSTATGYLRMTSVVEVESTVADPVIVAEAFIGSPTLAGGRTAKGVDAAALVQLAWAAAGVSLPRDADLQLAILGDDKTVASAKRGDLVFLNQHVSIMADADSVIHACPVLGTVTAEPLSAVIARASDAQTGEAPAPLFKRVR